jgi:predicted DNA-binding transcriptional regulator YafY
VSGSRDRGGAKWDRAARYLKIVRILHEHREGIAAASIADLVGVSKRTIYRDLEAMQLDADLPIWADGGRWGLAQAAFLPPLALTLHEATALFLAARMLAKTTDEQDNELVGALVKLGAVLPPVLAEHIAQTMDAFALTPRNERFTRVFRVLAEAWAGRRVVEIDYDAGVYDPGRGVRHTRVEPWALEPSALTHALYLIGWDQQRQARRTFKVERIVAASLTPDTFEAGGANEARDLLRAWDVISDEAPVNVVLRFSPAVARRAAETRWHPSQTTEEQADGSLLWRGRVAGLREIRIWILGWGADAEVLEPAELRGEVAAELRRSAALYSG